MLGGVQKSGINVRWGIKIRYGLLGGVQKSGISVRGYIESR